MEGDSKYRQKVRECLEKAMERKGPARHLMVDASRNWSRLAEEAEEFENILSEWDGKDADAPDTQAA